MPVSVTTITELNDLAKDLYQNLFQPMMAKGGQLKAQIEPLERWTFQGRQIFFAGKLSTGGGVANAGANATLPDNADGTYDQFTVSLKRTYARMAIDAFEIARLEQSSGSFRPALQEKMQDRADAMVKDINRQMYTDGVGKIALLAAGASSDTQTLTRAYFLSDGGNPGKHIYIGDNLAFHNSSNTLVGRRKVIAKTATLGTSTVDVQLDSTIDLSAVTNGYVSKCTADTTNVATGEVNGLLSAMAQSGNFQGAPIGSTYQATSLDAGGTLRDLDDTVVMTLVNTIHAQCEEYPDLAVTRPGIGQKYSEIFLPIRRIDGQAAQLKGGYRPIAAIQTGGGDAPMIGDTDCPGARLFMLNKKYVRNVDLQGEKWFALDGAQFSRVDGKDAVEGFMSKYWQMAYTRLNCHGVAKDLNDVATVDRIAS